MKLKKLMAAGLVSVMILGCLGGCGNSEGAPAADTSAQETQGPDTSADETTAKGDSEKEDSQGEEGSEGEDNTEAASGSYNVTWEDMAELNMLLMCPGSVPTGLQEVEDAINEITEAEINTHVNYEMIEIGNYIQQVSLKMSSSEQVDIVLTFPAGAAGFTAMQTQGQLMDITELLDEYGQGVKAAVGDYLKATTVEGGVYAVPIARDIVTGEYLIMRTDVLEDLGLKEKAENLSSLGEFEEILEAVKSSEKWSYLSGMASATGNGAVIVNGSCFPGVDSLDNSVLYDPVVSDLFVVDPTGADSTVVLTAGTDAFREAAALGHDWYEKGYIYKDAVTEKETGSSLVKSDKVFSYLSAGEMGIEATAKLGCGMDMTCVKLLTNPITTSACTKFTWAIPNSSEYPEAAVTFLNMMYTDARINNLMAWGIEGRDYVVENGVAKYPEGVTEPPYHGADFITGNQFLTLPWDGQDTDIREQAKAAMTDAPVSAYLGFTFNTDEIQTEQASVTGVYEEYKTQIASGIAEPTIIDEYISKLEASGVDVVLNACQEQLDAWIEANK